MHVPSTDFESFKALAAKYERVPVVATFVCDELTPVSGFARLAADRPYAFLLESVVGGEKIARYSFLGCDPALVIEAYGRRVLLHELASAGAARVREVAADDPLRVLEAELGRHTYARVAGLPRFVGGLVGYAAYDAVRYYEHLPGGPPDDRRLPDLLFGLYESMVVFDHVHKTALIVAHADTQTLSPRAAFAAATGRIEAIVGKLSEPAGMRPVRVTLPAAPLTRFASNFSAAEFERSVERCKEYIRAGDIFQVVLSQRLGLETGAAPFDIYRALRVVNPSPFMFYLKSPPVVLVGASPEIMCRVEDGVVTNRPLAGTRRRGETEEEDRRLREELLADAKERAEHVMLVDLGRNDVGRVSEPGSVRVSEVMSVECYSHVMHLSSNVTGRLAQGMTAFDALRAALPVGTVSGAPKVRAMQIIDELEPARRGPYAGAVGYVDFAGNMDTCIALRTIVIRKKNPGDEKDAVAGAANGERDSLTHEAFIQVGAGIVADSSPREELQETMNKANGMLSAIRVAEEQFGTACGGASAGSE